MSRNLMMEYLNKKGEALARKSLLSWILWVIFFIILAMIVYTLIARITS